MIIKHQPNFPAPFNVGDVVQFRSEQIKPGSSCFVNVRVESMSFEQDTDWYDYPFWWVTGTVLNTQGLGYEHGQTVKVPSSTYRILQAA